MQRLCPEKVKEIVLFEKKRKKIAFLKLKCLRFWLDFYKILFLSKDLVWLILSRFGYFGKQSLNKPLISTYY